MEWVYKSKTVGNSSGIEDYAVSISVVRTSHHGSGADLRHNLIFRMINGAENLITQTGYAIYALDKERNRVYFKNANAENGWKMTRDGGSAVKKRLQIACGKGEQDEWRMRKGTYKLLLDRSKTLYYIDLNKRLA